SHREAASDAPEPERPPAGRGSPGARMEPGWEISGRKPGQNYDGPGMGTVHPELSRTVGRGRSSIPGLVPEWEIPRGWMRQWQRCSVVPPTLKMRRRRSRHQFSGLYSLQLRRQSLPLRGQCRYQRAAALLDLSLPFLRQLSQIGRLYLAQISLQSRPLLV